MTREESRKKSTQKKGKVRYVNKYPFLTRCGILNVKSPKNLNSNYKIIIQRALETANHKLEEKNLIVGSF